MIRAALVGAGIAGRDMIAQLRASAAVELVAVVDVNRAVAGACADAAGCRAYTDVREMAKRERPDLVAVASSNNAHAANVIDAVEAGVRNIYCEKPLAIRIDEARQMVEAVEAYGVRTTMGFAGLHPGCRRIMELIRTGRLGRVLSLYAHTYRGYGFWGRERMSYRGVRGRHAAVQYPEVSGGWTIHHACHSIFLLMAMAGPVRSVFGKVDSSAAACPSEELINATLLFQDGAVGTLLDSIGSFRGTRCGVIGTHGTVLLQDHSLKHPGGGTELHIHYEREDDEQVERVGDDASPVTRLQELLEAIRNDAPSPIPLRAGLENLLVCHAVLEASRRERVVDLAPPVELGSRARFRLQQAVVKQLAGSEHRTG